MYPDLGDNKHTELNTSEKLSLSLFLLFFSVMFTITGILYHDKVPGSLILTFIGVPFLVVSIMGLVIVRKEKKGD